MLISIISTIKNKPELFFAYNNGITASGSLSFRDNKFHSLRFVENVQTTAQCIMQNERGTFIKVYVQMKLSVINSEKIVEFVPKILSTLILKIK